MTLCVFYLLNRRKAFIKINSFLDMDDRTEQVTRSLITRNGNASEGPLSVNSKVSDVSIQINGISVKFPKEPYPCQVDYMSKVIEAIKRRTNALLESPTGTGKTLCLLCSSLAWQMYDARANPSRNAVAASVANSDSGPKEAAKTIIIYATRTHSQLQQVVSELRETSYRPKMSILGSREQLCVHEKISKLKGSTLNHACSTITMKRGCKFRNNMDGFSDGAVENEVMDIEDLVEVGKKKSICPYYYSRDTSAAADILFMPYNYLLDNSVRRTMKINFENAVVIFDEAHNLEKVAADSASFSITSADIAACIRELQKILTHLKEDISGGMSEPSSSASASTSKSTFDFDSMVEKPTLAGVASILQSAFSLEAEFDNVTLFPNTVNSSPGAKYPGRWLVDVFQGVGFRNYEIMDEFQRCIKYLMDIDSDEMRKTSFDSASATSSSSPKLEILAKAVERIFRSIGASVEDYKVYIHDKEIKKPAYNNYNNNRIYTNNPPKKTRVINFWCFSTGVALRELTNLGVRSVIVTSGTLSPIEALKDDFQIPFPIQLQNPHIISNHQIVVAALSQGISGVKLNSSYENRKNPNYVDELGNTILSICDSLVLKDRDPLTPLTEGGVLIFFPSYKVMEESIERWKFAGIFDRLKDLMRNIIVEPRASGGKENKTNSNANTNSNDKTKKIGGFMLDASVSNSKGKLLADDMFEDDEISEEVFQSIVEEFDRSIVRHGRCLMIGVCRGKVSEGIDFSDNKGRAVILTGIPFAPHVDPWVVLKREYLDEKAANKITVIAAATAPPPPPPVFAPAANTSVPILATLNSANSSGNSWLQAKIASNSTTTPTAASVTTTSAPVSNAATNAPNSNANISGSVSKSKLTGQMWYQQSACRAVNQALGRVIRHKNDWGAIFLLDERFQFENNMSQLSSWMRPCIRKSSNANAVLLAFTDFLRRVNQDPKLRYDPSLYVKPSMVPTNAPAARLRSRPKLVYENSQEIDPFQQFIEVSGTQLAQCHDDQFFISKDMIVRSGMRSDELRGPKVGQQSMTEEEIRIWEKLQEANHSTAQNMANNGLGVAAGSAKDLKSLLTSRQQGRNAGNDPIIINSSHQSDLSVMPPPRSLSLPIFTASHHAHLHKQQSSSSSTSMSEIVDLNESDDNIIHHDTDEKQLFFIPSQIETLDEKILPSETPQEPSLILSQLPTQTQPLSTSTSGPARFGLGSSSVRKNSSTLGSFSSTQTQPLLMHHNQSSLQVLPSTSSLPSNSQPISSNVSCTANTQPPSTVFSMSQRLQSLTKISSSQQVKDEQQRRITLDIKAFLDEAQRYLPERPLTELKRYIDNWRQRGGLRGVAQMHPFQSELLTLVDGNLLYEVPLSVKKSALVTMRCLVSDVTLMNTYETVAKQLMSSLLKRTRDAIENGAPASAGNSNKPVNSSSNSSSNNPTTTQTSILAQAAARKVQAANVEARTQSFGILGKENDQVLESMGSKRAKLMLQLSKTSNKTSLPASQSSSAALDSNTSTVAVKPSFSLLDKLKEFDKASETLSSFGKKKFTSQPQQVNVKRVTNIKCSICMEEEEPLRAQCGHVCCKTCWLKQLKIRPACPICRTSTDTSQLARIRLATSTTSS